MTERHYNAKAGDGLQPDAGSENQLSAGLAQQATASLTDAIDNLTEHEAKRRARKVQLRYVVLVDLSPAVDQHGHLDEHKAGQIAYQCSGFPPGATVRLFIGAASSAHLPRLAELLGHAAVIEIIGSVPHGMRYVGDSLAGVDPFALQVVDS